MKGDLNLSSIVLSLRIPKRPNERISRQLVGWSIQVILDAIFVYRATHTQSSYYLSHKTVKDFFF